MNRPLALCAGLVLLPLLALVVRAEDKPDPREKLETAIPEAIRLLEAKEYVMFFKTFVAPEDLKEIEKTESFEEVVAQFGERKAAPALAMLKAVADLQPKLSADGKIAEYTFPAKIDGKGSMAFKKVDKYWYIRN